MDETRIIERGGRRWSVRRAAEPLLADGWPPDQPERLAVVKRGHRRTVLRFEVGGAGYFLKQYESGGLLGWLRGVVGLSPVRREWEALTAARAAGLDVPEPIALALGPREAILTREIPAAQRLDEYLFERYFEPLPGDPPYPGARPPELVAVYRRRRRPPEGTIDPPSLARALADLIAGMIRAGLALGDFHPGNILISGGPGGWRLSLVDLAASDLGAGPEEIGLSCMMQLEHFFEPIASVAERLRCLAHLAELLGASGGSAWSLADARHLARATARYRQAFYRHRDHRLRRGSKYFRRIASAVRPQRGSGPRAAHPGSAFGPAADHGRAAGRARVAGWRGWATGDWADAVEAWLTDAAEKMRLWPDLRGRGGPGGAGPDCGTPALGRADCRESPQPRAAVPQNEGGGGNLADLFGPDAEVLKAGGTSTVIRARLGPGAAAHVSSVPCSGATLARQACRGLTAGGLPASAPGTRADKPPVAPAHGNLPDAATDTAAARWLILKRHNRAARRSAVRGLLGGSRSVAAFRNGHALLARGIATARPAAAADLVRHGKVRDSMLMTEAVEDALPLPEWLRSNPAPALRRRMAWRLARLIRRLHDADLTDRDLKAPNILIASAHGPDPRPVLVDLDGLRGVWRVSARRRARDLMRLSVSLDEWGVARRTDRLRFLRAYLGRPGCPAPITVLHRRRGDTMPARRLRRWWRRIARLSARKMETLRRKGAPTG